MVRSAAAGPITMNRAKQRPWLVVAGAVLVLGATAVPAAADTLKVCLESHVPPMSFNRGGKSGGFDLAVAEAVAKHLGRTFAVEWYSTDVDPDSQPFQEVDALLSDGLCQLVGGYPLYADALGKPEATSATMPHHEGAKPGDRRRRVPLGTLVPTNGYRFAPITVILGAKAADRKIDNLGDLAGLKVGAKDGSLADGALMAYRGGRLAPDVVHVNPNFDILARLDRGDFDAAMVELHEFDAFRAAHPATKLKASGFYYRIGFNMGFVGLASEPALIAQVNQALDALLKANELPAMAKAAGATYLPPRQPEVTERILPIELYRE